MAYTDAEIDAKINQAFSDALTAAALSANSIYVKQDGSTPITGEQVIGTVKTGSIKDNGDGIEVVDSSGSGISIKDDDTNKGGIQIVGYGGIEQNTGSSEDTEIVFSSKNKVVVENTLNIRNGENDVQVSAVNIGTNQIQTLKNASGEIEII